MTLHLVRHGRPLIDPSRPASAWVGHGTAWTVLAAGLTGSEPDLERWAALAMPDVITISI